MPPPAVLWGDPADLVFSDTTANNSPRNSPSAAGSAAPDGQEWEMLRPLESRRFSVVHQVASTF